MTSRRLSIHRSSAPSIHLWMCVAVALLMLGARLAAHPTASSFVVIGVQEREIEVAITTDERAMVLKLQALSGAAATGAGDLGAMARVLREHVSLEVDGQRAALELRRVDPLPDRPGQVRLLLAAPAEAGVRQLQWSATVFFGAYPLAVQAGSATAAPSADRQYDWVLAAEKSRVYALSALTPGAMGWSSLGRLVFTGFTHILPSGLDHVLFVLGLALLSTRLRTLALQISLFTVAHSATLGLALAGVIPAPGAIVEPLIAVSIAYIAVENLWVSSLSYWRLVLVLAFGLLHGLGFAGALRDTGLAGGSLVETLVGFNIGVELGQLTVVAGALIVLRVLPWRDRDQHRLVLRPASAAIAAVGLFWAVQRTFF